MSMMPFEEARARVLERVRPVSETEEVALDQALGRVLAAPVVAGVSVPNHANSAMDGYAVRWDDLSQTEDSELTVVGTVPAGGRAERPLGPGQAMRIFTGAPVPEGCDCVVIQEVVRRDGDRLIVPAGQERGQNVRAAGQDITAGATILPAGHRLSPPDVGLITSVGQGRVRVWRRLRVAVLSTGNEVFEPGADQPPDLAPGQLFDSNRAALKAALVAAGVEVIDLGIARDVREQIAGALRRGAAEADIVLTSGGVSVGDFDLVKDVIAELGAIDFWKVAMKPGKPQAHGRLGRAEFFGLPGNPVSVMVTYLLFVRPAIEVMSGAPAPALKVLELPWQGAPLHKRHARAEFARGVIRYDGAGAHVTSTGAQGSGILSSMSAANALVWLPEGPVDLAPGDPVRVIPIEW